MKNKLIAASLAGFVLGTWSTAAAYFPIGTAMVVISCVIAGFTCGLGYMIWHELEYR